MARTAACVALVFLGILGGHAHAQGIVMQRNLSLAMAKTIAEATLAECKAKGFNTSAAVVDRAGQPLVLLRDEQATRADTGDVAAQGIHGADVSYRRRSNSRSAAKIRR